MKTIKKHLILSSIVIFGVASTLFALYATTHLPNNELNGFKRNFREIELRQIQSTPVGNEFYQICGSTPASIFLVGQNPLAIFKVGANGYKKDTFLIGASIPADKISPFKVLIDSPFIYLHINNLSTTLQGKLIGDSSLKFTKLKSELFTKSVQISSSTMIARAFNTQTGNQVFRKINSITGETLKESQLINQQGDNGMSTDGFLLYNQKQGNLYYTQFFSNEILCIDTNLNIVFAKTTIDTTNNIQIRLTTENRDNGKANITSSFARNQINRLGFTNEQYLFIASSLRSDNESIADFRNYDPIDIYKLNTGEYIGSFHIPKLNNQSFRSALAKKDTLFVLHYNQLNTYILKNL